jgi:asparagine synthase (glutamine-hydrolysing)
MANFSTAPVKTFSVGFKEESFNELPYADLAARICGTEHHAQIVTSDVEAILPAIVRHYGEPYGDPSAIPSFLVCETARGHVTVALNGDGGDELLGGYPRYWLSNRALLSGRLLGRLVSAQSLASLTTNFSAESGFGPRVMSRLVREFLHPELGSLVNYRNHWNDRARHRLLMANNDPALLPAWRRKWLGHAYAHAANPVDRMLYFDNHTYLPDDLLVKMDIASMHCSLEARSPLLDHELAEFCAGLPLNQKLRNGAGKYLLKRLAAKTFGQEFVNRPKQGFGIPLENWLKGTLRPRVRAVLSDPGLMEPFDRAVVARTASDFFSERPPADHTSRVWGLFMFGLWRESLASAASPDPATPHAPVPRAMAEPALQCVGPLTA